ncbi:GGDEF domain-containing protein [Noviherbaspirillum massiliense]|uniref:GGDEF domain-containing protein n=1 Tax=Noviherbaspirillum massiliense TaxID=1465823 RepID=UPI0002D2DE22|nr:GGDEF domain-containing protein [Noviherbaspirillum massiliense]
MILDTNTLMLVDETSDAVRTPPLNRRLSALKTRTTQFSPLSLISLLYALNLFIFYQQEFISDASFLCGSAFVLCTVIFFYGLFKLGANKRFEDPTLMLPQLCATVSIMLLMAYIDRATQPALVPFILIAFSFGIFRLSTRSLVLMSAACVSAYLGIILMHADQAEQISLLRHDFMQWCVLALTLPGMIVVGKQIQNLRQLLRLTRYQLAHFEEKATRDELTGLYNRRQLQDELERARAHARASSTPFCICLIDIDHFKKINDGSGHLTGDTMLREFARVARNSIRDTDILGRYGGDEFMQILPDTDLKGAVMHAERLRVQAHFLDFQALLPQKHISLSIGIAQYRDGESLLDLIARADAALYRAKQLGRNRVEWAEAA